LKAESSSCTPEERLSSQIPPRPFDSADEPHRCRMFAYRSFVPGVARSARGSYAGGCLLAMMLHEPEVRRVDVESRRMREHRSLVGKRKAGASCDGRLVHAHQSVSSARSALARHTSTRRTSREERGSEKVLHAPKLAVGMSCRPSLLKLRGGSHEARCSPCVVAIVVSLCCHRPAQAQTFLQYLQFPAGTPSHPTPLTMPMTLNLPC
jgi:hypothetical protein